MKRSLVSLAVLAAVADSQKHAPVQLHGIVDLTRKPEPGSGSPFERVTAPTWWPEHVATMKREQEAAINRRIAERLNRMPDMPGDIRRTPPLVSDFQAKAMDDTMSAATLASPRGSMGEETPANWCEQHNQHPMACPCPQWPAHVSIPIPMVVPGKELEVLGLPGAREFLAMQDITREVLEDMGRPGSFDDDAEDMAEIERINHQPRVRTTVCGAEPWDMAAGEAS